jgi:predicted short-subunit dehydrogenase-like oxidoreductase (DUF2520 family)
MKKRLQAGLIVEGNSTNSTVLRLPKIPEELGPIKSRALRVARRLSNLLKAGYPVPNYEGLRAARLILLRVPDSSVPRIVDELCQSELVFRDLSFVLCESWLPTGVLEPLTERGASVATLASIPNSGRKWFVVEGQLAAVRQTRRFIELNGARALELRPGTKQLYFAAVLLATTVPIPLFLAAQKALRETGLSGNHLRTVLNELAQSMFKGFSKGARGFWGGPLTECSNETASAHFEALRRSNPQLAELVTEELARARHLMTQQKPRRGDLFREATG